MPVRASNLTPSRAYADVKQMAREVDTFVRNERRIITSGGKSDRILGIFHQLRRVKEGLTSRRAVSNLVSHAKAEENDPTYDIVVEVDGLIAAIDSAMLLAKNLIPIDAQGFIREKRLNAGGTYEFIDFTPQELANLRDAMTAVTAEILIS